MITKCTIYDHDLWAVFRDWRFSIHQVKLVIDLIRSAKIAILLK